MMAKRGYKLQFVAHSGNVNCLSIGKKTSRLLLTGGDDYKVNLWSIGKTTSLMSLCGHTSPVDSVAFNSGEILVLGGASSGVIKLWDLEEAKMVRAFTGHRSNCSAVEFHPFGEFLASGSSDTNLRVWDTRKKGCIQTYKGHTCGISTIRFSPDGRWVVSGGLDNVVKVWDLTAGKLLHEFKFHEGPIRSLDFHPLEFLLATGSADRTVKFWDLETFELIGSTRPEAAGVRAIAFHPDGQTLFCGLDDGLKVYSWEPVICRDGVDMGWSTLGDFCINEGKFIGCSYYRNSVGIWVSDISELEPYGAVSEDKNECMLKRFSVFNDQSERMGSGPRGSVSPDYETKEIKNIYVDSTGGNSNVAQNPGSLKATLPLESGKVATMASEKQNATYFGQAGDKYSSMHTVASRDSDSGEESSYSERESITFSRTKSGMLLRPAHVRKTLAKFEESKQSAVVQSATRKKSGLAVEEEPQTQNVLLSEQNGSKPFDAEDSTIKGITDKFEKGLSSEPPTDETNRMFLKPPRVHRSSNSKYNDLKRVMSADSATFDKGGMEYSGEVEDICSKTERVLSPEKPGDEQKNTEYPSSSRESNPVKIVKGVNVVSGRTRSLVEKFERGEKITHTEAASTTITQNTNAVLEDPRKTSRQTGETPVISTRRARSTPARVMPIVLNRDSNMTSDEPLLTQPARTSVPVMPVILSQATNVTYDEPRLTQESRTSPSRILPVTFNQATNITSEEASVTSRRPRRNSAARVRPVSLSQADMTSHECPVTSVRPARTSPARVMPTKLNQSVNMTSDTSHIASRHRVSPTQMLTTPTVIDQVADMTLDETHATQIQPACDNLPQKEEPNISERENDSDITENLMLTHNKFLTTLQSRLTKLQIVRHFWERSDVKGAIGALRKLTDQSVQADVISILTDKIEILTLDMFSQLVPVLTSLLGSRTERPVNVSLDMLLKLVAVFGTVIRSTVSAPRIVGVDLHADERLEICQICSAGLHKIQRILPVLARRGGLITRKAQELNLVLQEP
ncbi:katanin p80 WD40 repeat-containing subunit B1 homolog isoform X2 [Arabidopsis lyrata subsp. lyrata]|uniref:katanin p80 WD40 repeat-containing subunit B1 homolog isoform X2 n=1 Tax=Arabidopsis lyrata subsp. lyrata TaxID=81972 RepID=UPI000A29B215|nr:katanin p80 WD40 repeat-containing subunit B1 homolog isoform X2 [Arabidopsis lyrata subsp. lyrata]|eukprot:XP_020870620.1 katanin p80 WD40 repeat-containing subunit B1 homolog isoform X2 [Arabidopsis lyrata subsp. lyrata]